MTDQEHDKALGPTDVPRATISRNVADRPRAVYPDAWSFATRLDLEMRRAERCGSALSLVCIETSSDMRDLLSALEALAARLDALPRAVACRWRSDEVVLMLPETSKAAAQHAGPDCLRPQMAGTLVFSYPDDFSAAVRDGHDPADLPFVRMTECLSRRRERVKRGIDIVLAAVLIVLLSPVLAMTAGAVALGSSGPVFFQQPRVGRGGRRFILYKFRSMYDGADDRSHREHVARLIKTSANPTGDDAVWSQIDGDPRITPIGRLMRRLKLDELPQLVNVLKGDLSLIGPRPALHYEVALYQAWHIRRFLHARPGITGLWQITGDDHTTFDEMVRMDLHYLDHWSILGDLVILAKTALLVLRRLLEPIGRTLPSLRRAKKTSRRHSAPQDLQRDAAS